MWCEARTDVGAGITSGYRATGERRRSKGRCCCERGLRWARLCGRRATCRTWPRLLAESAAGELRGPTYSGAWGFR